MTRRRIAALLAVAVLAGTLTVALTRPSRATAESSALRPGLGHRLPGGDFVGFFRTRSGRKVYCLNPDKAAPKSIALSAVQRYPGVGTAVTAELSYALSAWGDARSDTQAATESQVLNTLAGNRSAVHRRSRSLSHSINARVAALVRLAKQFRGPYTVRVTLPNALLPGQSGIGEVRVRSAGGHDLTGVLLSMSSSANGTVPRTARTDRSGVARFRYAVTDVGEVHVSGAARGLAPGALLASHPRSYQQRMVSWQRPGTAYGSASFEQTAEGFSNSYACTTACNGHPTVRLTACAAPSTYAARLDYALPGKSVRVLYPAAIRRRCTTIPVVLADGARVSAAWRFATRHGWSRPISTRATFVVDCPAVPSVAVSMSYDCSAASVTVALAERAPNGMWTPLVNRSKHRMVLVIGGAKSTRIYAGTGQRAVFSSAASCGTPVTYTLQAGIRRSEGSYNYGARASVTTPGEATAP